MTTETCPISKLQEVADQLVKTFAAKATSNQSYFVNDIPGHLQLRRDPQVIASVLSGLLTTVVFYTKDSCIQLSAQMYGNMVLVRVRNSGFCNINAIESQLQTLLPLAERMKGSIGFTSQRNKITTICFGFSNLPA
jgi:hypothetical protein